MHFKNKAVGIHTDRNTHTHIQSYWYLNMDDLSCLLHCFVSPAHISFESLSFHCFYIFYNEWTLARRSVDTLLHDLMVKVALTDLFKYISSIKKHNQSDRLCCFWASKCIGSGVAFQVMSNGNSRYPKRSTSHGAFTPRARRTFRSFRFAYSVS